MNIISWSINTDDDYTIKGNCYKCDNSPKGAIVISHGMGEHHKRYKLFAEFLVNNGYNVYTYNHRGHGKELSINNLGHFDNENGWNKVVKDCIKVIIFVKEENQDKKIFLFGHSMGSLIVRNVIQLYDEFDGVIISATIRSIELKVFLGIILSKIIVKLFGKRHKTKLMHKLLFGRYNKKFKPNRTKSDWLSRDIVQVDLYESDTYCGFICSAQFYNDLLNGLKSLSKKDKINITRKDLPIFLISGDDDPAGEFGKSIKLIYNNFKNLNFIDVTMKLYSKARHELLNEINNEEVYRDVLKWLNIH